MPLHTLLMSILSLASDARQNNGAKKLSSVDWIEYCTSTVCLSLSFSPTLTHTHTQFLHVQSPQGPRWYSLSLSQTAGPCLRSEPSDFERGRKHYYHIITGVIRALFGAHAARRGLGSVLERHSFSDRAFIYLQYIVPSFPQCLPPSLEASRSPVSVPVQQREWGAVVSEREKQERGNRLRSIGRLNKCCIGYVSRYIQNNPKTQEQRDLSNRICIILVHLCYKCTKETENKL